MSRPFRKRGDGELFCYHCDGKQREGTRRCRATLRNGQRCESVAFYRVRRPGGARVKMDAAERDMAEGR
jgi:hypothetical protein